MGWTRSIGGAALTALLLGSLPGYVSAQRTRVVWVDLVQMPVAVARLELAGAPVADLRLLVPALNVREVSPTLFIETVRGVSVLEGRRATGRGAQPGMGPVVRALHDRGLRGTELANAIHRELRARGVPAGVGAGDARPGVSTAPGRGALDRPLLLPRGEGRGRGQAPRRGTPPEVRPDPRGGGGPPGVGRSGTPPGRGGPPSMGRPGAPPGRGGPPGMGRPGAPPGRGGPPGMGRPGAPPGRGQPGVPSGRGRPGGGRRS